MNAASTPTGASQPITSSRATNVQAYIYEVGEGILVMISRVLLLLANNGGVVNLAAFLLTVLILLLLRMIFIFC